MNHPEKFWFVLIEECPPAPPANATRAVKKPYDRWIASNNKAKTYMLASISDALRIKMEPMETAFEIMESLQGMFGHEATRKYTNARMVAGTHVHDHVMQMTNHFSEAEMHGAVVDEATQVSIILNSLSSDFIPFTRNYIMNKLNYGMTQLLNELQTFESISGIVKNKSKANVADKPSSSKGLKNKKAKGGKLGGKFKKPKIGAKIIKPNNKKAEKKPKGKCFHCGVDGHWKKNCPRYLVELKEKNNAA
ncbi:uncharacterized protein [Henckelia pumila]|uniref:uncharacterized protein isoform X3 n=1 Tax=Henckelia pumila TaxID=405737 RepID=UPI003C6DD2D4